MQRLPQPNRPWRNNGFVCDDRKYKNATTPLLSASLFVHNTVSLNARSSTHTRLDTTRATLRFLAPRSVLNTIDSASSSFLLSFLLTITILIVYYHTTSRPTIHLQTILTHISIYQYRSSTPAQQQCLARVNLQLSFPLRAKPHQGAPAPASHKASHAAAAKATGQDSTSNATTQTAKWDGTIGNASR